ncbi:MAG: polysaccharide deacetylase family protein [Clostridia bacterium]|nr:polysaccharide deacetylase family protein [Clostridia bacterium]
MKTVHRSLLKAAVLTVCLVLAFSVVSCGKQDAPSGQSEQNTIPTVESLDFTPIESDVQTAAQPETAPPPETETAATTDSEPAAPPTEGGIAPLALMYHLILDEPYSALESLFVRPSELRGHIEALLEKGYTFIFADEYGAYDTKTVIMSFDDGYLDNYTEMFPIIKEYNVKVTVFMISDYINGGEYLSEDMIKEMSASGLVSFQSHTASHPSLATLGADALRNEFSTSNSVIEALTGRPVKAICYPSGQYNDLTLSVASEYYSFGYTTFSTNSTAGYPYLELPRLRVNRGYSKDYFASLIN